MTTIEDIDPKTFMAVFPFLFVGMWLAITTILSRMSGWSDLQDKYPDRTDEVLRKFYFQSGQMGPGGNRLLRVNYGSILTLAACKTGLWISVWKIFGLFDRPILVPWKALSVERKKILLVTEVVLHLDRSSDRVLVISARLANKLAASAPGLWPEAPIRS